MHDDLGLLAALFEKGWRDMLDHLMWCPRLSVVLAEKVGLVLEKNASGARRCKKYFRIPSDELIRNGSQTERRSCATIWEQSLVPLHDFVDHKLSKNFSMSGDAVVLVFLEHKVTKPSAVNGPGDTLLLHLSIGNLLSFGLALHGTDDKLGWTRFQ